MSINYYNTVEDMRSAEKPFSVWNKLDQWGTKLVDPRKAAYGGHTYVAHSNNIAEVADLNAPEQLPLTLGDRIKVRVGVILKQIAAFFSKVIRSKYQHVDDTIRGNIKKKPDVKATKQGNDFDWIVSCLTCCTLCGECCDPQPSCGRRRCN